MLPAKLIVDAGEARILQRVRRSRGTLEGVTEFDFAWDSATGVTDQDHVGGAAFVGELARAAGIVEQTRVVDLCCRLGGSARFLAATRGSSVHGIERNRERCAAAQRLNALVGLEDRVTIECADVMSAPVPRERFDVLWGQSAWTNLPDRDAFVARWLPALAAGGRIAFEDTCLHRAPRTAAEHARLAALEKTWRAHPVATDAWLATFEAGGLLVDRVESLSERARDYFEGRLARTIPAPAVEVAGWTTACALIEAGIIGYVRVVAIRS